MLSYRTIMIAQFVAFNYLILSIYAEYKGTPSAYGGLFSILLWLIVQMIATITVGFTTGLRQFKKIDILLFLISSPIGTLCLLLLRSVAERFN